MQRRDFLKTGAVLAGGLAISRGKAFAAPVGARVEVMVNEPLGTIAPEVYGHFTEHLGGTIYDGVWVGTKSKIANTNGIRSALVEKMRQIKAPAVRWPGGCFADSYDWRDGIGPRDKRPSRTSFWADNLTPQQMSTNPVQAFDDNAFGTDEFVNLLQAERLRAVSCCQPSQPACAAVRPVGGVLQLACGQHHAGEATRRGGIVCAVQRAVLGRRE